MNKYYKIIEDGIEYEVKEYTNGNKYWYLNKKLHRENGPAIEFTNGYKVWCKNGKYHREDGPAVIYSDGKKKYYLNGIWYPDVNSPEELLLASIIL